MLDVEEIEVEIAKLEYKESSYSNYSKLADLYTIRNEICRESNTGAEYSYSAPTSFSIGLYGESDFLKGIFGKDPDGVFAVLDELMDTLRVVNPRAYNSVMRAIRNL